jgi:2-keto-3-deoxy-L-rhamnonate aldolase RhmA
MKLMFITNDENVIKEADQAGVDRIFIDLEVNGKFERQGHLDTHIADHKIGDIEKARKLVTKSEILVRINPLYKGTQYEVDTCIELGADIIMLPMFKTYYEVEQFIKMVDGRAKVCLLLETAQAFVRINQILELDGIDEIHVGLNDLHLSLGLSFMFELVSEGIVEYLATLIKSKGIAFGFGGIAIIGAGDLKSELVIGEHYRLGSQMVILSRTFRNANNDTSNSIKNEIKKIRAVEEVVNQWSQEQYLINSKLVKEQVREIVNKKQYVL